MLGVVLVVLNSRLKGVLALAWLQVPDLATHLPSRLHHLLYLNVVNLVLSHLLDFLLVLQFAELLLDTALHLHSLDLAQVPLLTVKRLGCGAALQKGKVGRVGSDLFPVSLPFSHIFSLLACHRLAHIRPFVLATKLLQILLDVLKSIRPLRGHHTHELHFFGLERFCVEEFLKVESGI